jgi:hypothetical protein
MTSTWLTTRPAGCHQGTASKSAQPSEYGALGGTSEVQPRWQRSRGGAQARLHHVWCVRWAGREERRTIKGIRVEHHSTCHVHLTPRMKTTWHVQRGGYNVCLTLPTAIHYARRQLLCCTSRENIERTVRSARQPCALGAHGAKRTVEQVPPCSTVRSHRALLHNKGARWAAGGAAGISSTTSGPARASAFAACNAVECDQPLRCRHVTP